MVTPETMDLVVDSYLPKSQNVPGGAMLLLWVPLGVFLKKQLIVNVSI